MIPSGLDLKDRKSVKTTLKGIIKGEYTNVDDRTLIQVSNKGINEVTSHGMNDKANVKSFFAIPEMLRKSILIDERKNEKNHTEYDVYRYYVCGLKINDEDYTAKLVIGQKNGGSYYDHRLSQIEKGKLIDSLNGLSNSGAADQHPYDNEYKDTTLESLLQIMDEGKEKRFRDGDLGLDEAITKMKADAAAATGASFKEKKEAMKAIRGNLSKLRQAMARQREYDITTVKSAIKDAVGRTPQSRQT